MMWSRRSLKYEEVYLHEYDSMQEARAGIGCYFDDLVHRSFGIRSRAWQSLYHFTVGGPLNDERLATLPAYPDP